MKSLAQDIDNVKSNIEGKEIVKVIVRNNFVQHTLYEVIRISDGHITLQVLDKGKDYILCEVLNDGVLEDHKGVNVPGVRFNMPFLSDQDRDDILLANTLNVDFLALSFVHTHEA